jgi:hypothetical protein
MGKAVQTSNAVVLDLCLRLFPAPQMEATKWNAMFDQKGLLSNTGQGHFSCSPCSKGISAHTVVPLPGADSMLSWPPTISTRSFMPISPSRFGFFAKRTVPT